MKSARINLMVNMDDLRDRIDGYVALPTIFSEINDKKLIEVCKDKWII